MAARPFLKIFALFLLITGATAIQCPETDYSFGTCASATKTITIDWTDYPTAACQEVKIVIPKDYAIDTCTWRVELANIPTLTSGITVNAVTGGAADVSDMLTIVTELSMAQDQQFTGNLDSLYTNTYRASVSPPNSANGEADAVEITFESAAGYTGDGFTIRVVLYAIDATTACGTASSPREVSLTTDYPVAALATTNFPRNHPMGAECYTHIDCPEGYTIRIDYIAVDIVNLEDFFFIFDATDQANPILLRAETVGAFTAAQLPIRSFQSRTNNLHTVFSDRGTKVNPGVLALVTALLDHENNDCGACNCTNVPSSTGTECEDAGGFVAAVVVDNSMCDQTVPLTFTEATSQTYLATPNYPSNYVDGTACTYTITGPIGSELVIIFRDFQLSTEDNIILTGGSGIDRLARLVGTTPMFEFSDGTSGQTYSLLNKEIVITANRLVVSFVNPTDTGGAIGAAFEVRLVDNKLSPRCINGGERSSCSCASGYYGTRCQNVITIDCIATTGSLINEGDTISIRCTATRALSAITTVAFQVSSVSTAVDVSDFLLSNCVFPAGKKFCTVDIPTIDDIFVENEEQLVLIVSAVTDGANPYAAESSVPIVITISADADTYQLPVQFSSDTYEVSENDGSITVTIEFISSGQLFPIPEDGTIDITYTGTSDTAAVDNDYTVVTAVTFSRSTDGLTTSVDVVIPIVNDNVRESTETFMITMSITSSILQVGTTATATIRILDDDVAEHVVIIDWPNIRKRFGKRDVHLFAFSNLNRAVTWRKFYSTKPVNSASDLILDGTQYGTTVTLPLSRRLPARRLGLFKVEFAGGPTINTFVSPDIRCLNSDKATITVYPSSSNAARLAAVLTFGLDDSMSCATGIKWKRSKTLISNIRRTYDVTETNDLAGVYTLSLKGRTRSKYGWFEIMEVIVADCPSGFWGSDCSQGCDICQCENGGVREKNGVCTCPPCFTGETCQYKYTSADSFGVTRRFACSDLHSDLSSRNNCEGLLFCYGGLYGCSCGCGWWGRDCNKGCSAGYYGADCTNECQCVDALCDRFTGCQ